MSTLRMVLATVAAAACLQLPADGVERTAPYIVSLKRGVHAADHARSQRLRPTHVYTHALDGYAAALTHTQAERLRSHPSVEAVIRDAVIRAPEVRPEGSGVAQPAQVVPAFAQRVGADVSPTADIDGEDERVDVDVAVLDDGVQETHPDLNVAGGRDCVEGRNTWPDGTHGTFVAGIIGAIDNGIGIVGIAPGARLWDVRVLNRRGVGRFSTVLCGIDWVTKHADVIDVANMSLGAYAPEAGPCSRRIPRRPAGLRLSRIEHRAVCRSVSAGVTYVAAAGNQSRDAERHIPSAYPEVISVSAMADSDGAPGGTGPAVSGCGANPPSDDSFAPFSNFGDTVDLAAPGVCLRSTFPAGAYTSWSGTSFASPVVAGAAAIYLANDSDATPSEVRDALISLREDVHLPGDPDNIDEGVVDVSTF